MSKKVFTELKKAMQSLNSLIEQEGDGEVTDQLSDYISENPEMGKEAALLQVAFENSRPNHEVKRLSFGSCLYRSNDEDLLSLFNFLGDVGNLCKAAENNPIDHQNLKNQAEMVRWRLGELQEDVVGEFYERLQLYRNDLDRLNQLMNQSKEYATV